MKLFKTNVLLGRDLIFNKSNLTRGTLISGMFRNGVIKVDLPG